MTTEDIIRMAKMAGMHHLTWDSDYIDGTEYFTALVEQHLIASGYRKCAEGQKTTQHCALVEEAVKAEREACAKLCDEAVNRISETHDAEVREVATNVCINLGRVIRARGTT